MGYNPELTFKTDEEIKSHFLLRLHERYDITLSNDEYNELHNSGGFTKNTIMEIKPIHWARISSNKSAFIIQIKSKLIFTIYSNDRKKFITALPWDSYDDETRLVPLILKRLNLKEFAIKKYNEILSLCAKEYVDLGDSKQNYFHYKDNCAYPRLLMLEYKGRLTIGDIYTQILRDLELSKIKKHE